MKFLHTLACIALVLSGCSTVSRMPLISQGPPPPQPGCSLADIDIINADYEAQLQNIWTRMHDNLYVNTVAPHTREDRRRAAAYEAEMDRLEGETVAAYSNARSSCGALLSCEQTGAGGSYTGCDTLRGRYLIAIADFYAVQGKLDSQASKVAGYAPFEDVEHKHKDGKHGYHGKGYGKGHGKEPGVNREQDCPTVADVLTVCADKEH